MSYIESLILGIIQGITEFLPISSSGHLLIVRKVFGIESNISGSFIEVFLHGGTLLSILFFWKNELLEDYKRISKGNTTILFNVIIATIPASFVGLFFKEHIEHYFFNINNMSYLCLSYLFLAVLLYITKNYKSNTKSIIFRYALIIGLAQAFAIIPGISRAGVTIACGLLLGVHHKDATKFSFLLAIPILFFSFVSSVFENHTLLFGSSMFGPLIVGFIVSFIVGYLAIGFLVHLILKEKLWYFSIYCFILSLILGFYYVI